ncbi:MAG: hypothetical protein KC776_05600 [Myxococcales bacterium]|nr:hypothetical protein [Myxococcales bacterium]
MNLWPLLRDLQGEARPKAFLVPFGNALGDVVLGALQKITGAEPNHAVASLVR